MTPPSSWIIDGTLYSTDEATALESTDITFTNENEGESVTIKTGDNGVFIFDCANFPSGWTNGDIISFTAGGNATRGKYIKIKAIAHSGTQMKYLKCAIEGET